MVWSHALGLFGGRLLGSDHWDPRHKRYLFYPYQRYCSTGLYRYAVLYSSLKSTRVPVRLYPEYLERAVRLAVEFHTSYRTSYFILHTSYFTFHISYFILHTSYFILHKSYLPVTEFQYTWRAEFVPHGRSYLLIVLECVRCFPRNTRHPPDRPPVGGK